MPYYSINLLICQPKMNQIKKITINSPEYPSALKKIANPPKTLYIRGQIPKGPCFGIVGTRRCSVYGKQIALEISNDLALAGLIIVSGMAKGIDTAAHQACLQANGKTIAVLGTGLGKQSIYPQENLDLADKIIKTGGCLMSELDSAIPGYKSNFPARNRIISGLCLGVLVIEAKFKSGALITAKWARQQKRKLFAIPGPIHSLNSKGPNMLIKNGAILVESANDILKTLNLTCLTSEVKQLSTGPGNISNLSPEENLILQALKQNPVHIEKIIEQSNLPIQKVLSILSMMEVKNQIKNLGNNIYTIKR